MRVSAEIILSFHSVSRQSGEQTALLDRSLCFEVMGRTQWPGRTQQLECHITSRSNSRTFKGEDFSRSRLVVKKQGLVKLYDQDQQQQVGKTPWNVLNKRRHVPHFHISTNRPSEHTNKTLPLRISDGLHSRCRVVLGGIPCVYSKTLLILDRQQVQILGAEEGASRQHCELQISPVLQTVAAIGLPSCPTVNCHVNTLLSSTDAAQSCYLIL